MKNINQLIEQFKQITNPQKYDYSNLGGELTQAITLLPEENQLMSWEYVADNFSEKENNLIIQGASDYFTTDEQKKNFAEGITQIRQSIASLDNSISNLKTIKDPNGAMKLAIDALEQLKVELRKEYKSPTMH